MLCIMILLCYVILYHTILYCMNIVLYATRLLERSRSPDLRLRLFAERNASSKRDRNKCKHANQQEHNNKVIIL